MNRTMKDSGVKWIGEIPEHWGISTLRRVATLYTGNSIKDEEKTLFENPENAIPYISTKDITASNGITSYDNGLYVSKDNNNFKKAFEGNILICIEGGSAGKKKTQLSQNVAFVNKLCCISSKNINNRYLYLYTLGKNFEDYFQTQLTGIIGGVSINNLKKFSIPILSLHEQQKIADFLDDKTSQIDIIIDKTKQSIEEFKKYKLALITETVTKGLNPDITMKDSGIEWIGEIPEHWEPIKLKYVLSERSIKSKTGEEEPLSMSQKYGLIKTRDMDLIPNMTNSYVGNKIVKKNDLVFNKLKAHLGVFSVSNYEGIVSPDYAVYYPKKEVNVKFLEYVFKTTNCITEFKKRSRGIAAGLTRLYTNDLFAIKCGIPSLKEQNEIVDYINQKSFHIDSLIADKEKLITELETYKKALIFEYVTGKKEVE